MEITLGHTYRWHATTEKVIVKMSVAIVVNSVFSVTEIF